MNEDRKRRLKGGSAAAGIFAFLILSILILNHALAPSAEAALSESVAETLSAGSFAGIVPGKTLAWESSSASFSQSWEALKGNKRAGTLFAVSVTGTAGPWPTVFYHDAAGTVHFAGIIGRPDGISKPLTYGLTPRVLHSWQERIKAETRRREESK